MENTQKQIELWVLSVSLKMAVSKKHKKLTNEEIVDRCLQFMDKMNKNGFKSKFEDIYYRKEEFPHMKRKSRNVLLRNLFKEYIK